jgi:ABC-2 type transport system permease protein
VASAYRIERRKLSAQLAPRLLALICFLGPFAFAGVLKAQSGSPADTLFGASVHASGFAVALVVLGFAGAWGLPLVAGIIAGDVFSSEDRFGTWKTVLTRSCTRGELFAGKLLAVGTFVLALVGLSAAASLLAGLLLIGDQSLIGLSGNLIAPGHALYLVALSWLLCAFPALAFASLGVLLSVATRSGIVGVIGPALAALAMQLLLLVGSGVWMHTLLVGSAFNGWHPLFTAHPYLGPVVAAILVSLAWTVACVATAWALLRRREFAGVAAARRAGWARPAQTVAALAVVIGLLALAGNLGRVGVTAKRLQASLTPTFNSLTLLQQRELGRDVPAGAQLRILPSCSRRGSTTRGPGDWVCTLDVFIPQPGSNPFQQTPVTYDVNVRSDGCYKAESPPSFIGQQTMRDAQGNNILNPLFTIYGCFNVL